MTLDGYLDGLRLQMIEFGGDHCVIRFDNRTGITVYSKMAVNMIAGGEQPLFLGLQVTDEFFELKFTHECTISISRTPLWGPEVFVYHALDGQFIVE